VYFRFLLALESKGDSAVCKSAIITSLSILSVVVTTAGAADTGSAPNSTIQTAVTSADAHTYADAYKQTAETGKPLVVLVGASWCPACQSMKTSIMPTVAAQGGLDKVAFAYVNTDQQHELAGKLMEGGLIPQLVMFERTDDGWKQKRLVGAHSVSAVVSFVGSAERSSVASKAKVQEKATSATSQRVGSPQAAARSSAAVESHG
jgi:thiol-disulfide isomerase/thioredoxin